MAKKKEVKFNPAGPEDNIYVGYTNIASNEKKTELKVEGKDFSASNDRMIIQAYSNELILDEEKNTVTRSVNGKAISVSNVDEAKMKRLKERARTEELVAVGKEDSDSER